MFQSFKKKLQPFSEQSQNRVMTTLINARKRGGNRVPSQKMPPGNSESAQHNQLMTKFLNLKSGGGQGSHKISMEDRKTVISHDKQARNAMFVQR